MLLIHVDIKGDQADIGWMLFKPYTPWIMHFRLLCVFDFILWGMLCQKQGAVSIRKTVLPGMAIPMLKIRRPNGRLIFNMEITILR